MGSETKITGVLAYGTQRHMTEIKRVSQIAPFSLRQKNEKRQTMGPCGQENMDKRPFSGDRVV